MELSFVTYNIHKGIGTDRSYRLDRIIRICRELNPDFLALQEVPWNVPKAGNADIARIVADELGLNYTLGLNVRLRRGAYGNATFSRFAIRRHNNLNITWAIKKPRGCLNAELDLDNVEIAVMNFHLGLAGIERKAQMDKILRCAFLRERGDRPIVLLGDTNDVYNRLLPTVRRAGFADTSAAERRLRTFPAYASIWRLDKIYFNEHLSLCEHSVVRNKLTQVASDHLPVYVRLKLAGPQPSEVRPIAFKSA